MRPNDPPQPLATLMVATCNVLNLANPGRLFYENQDPYSQTEFERKITWLGERFRALNADVLAVQEVWDHMDSYRPLIAAIERRRLAVNRNGCSPCNSRLTPRTARR